MKERYFPLVDFQNGNTLVSLKSVDTAGSTWLSRMQDHNIDLGTNGAKVDGALANMVLDLRVQPSGLMSNGFKLRFGLLSALDQCFLVIDEAEWHNNTELEEEIRPVLELEVFIQAWISDVEYDFWQNATDPLGCEDVGRSLLGLSMRSNGLPPPLDQMEIDISGNPGRNVLRQGYVEAIGSTMWLGDLLWERVGADRLSKISLLESHGFKVHELGKILKVITSKNIFLIIQP